MKRKMPCKYLCKGEIIVGKVLIFGHKNPDTDTICSAIAYADLKKQLGLDARTSSSW